MARRGWRGEESPRRGWRGKDGEGGGRGWQGTARMARRVTVLCGEAGEAARLARLARLARRGWRRSQPTFDEPKFDQCAFDQPAFDQSDLQSRLAFDPSAHAARSNFEQPMFAQRTNAASRPPRPLAGDRVRGCSVTMCSVGGISDRGVLESGCSSRRGCSSSQTEFLERRCSPSGAVH